MAAGRSGLPLIIDTLVADLALRDVPTVIVLDDIQDLTGDESLPSVALFLAGGAIAGPMGAFMALPVAALITAVITNLGKTYDVVYQSRFDTDADDAAAASAEVEGS